MKENSRYRFDTLCIHGEHRETHAHRALNPPIYQTSTFVFDSIEDVEKVMDFQSDEYVYTRGKNPTLKLFEERMSLLEEGQGAVSFSSGMAAISSVLFSLLRPGDNLVVHRTLYGSSYNVTAKLLPEYGIGCRNVDLRNPENLLQVIDDRTRVIYFETPANPSLDIIDIEEVARIARPRGIRVVVDNTFATPVFQRPLTLGADVVVHSATKYICGHGDVVAGVAVARDPEYVHRLKFDYMCEFGGVLSPFNGWLLLRGMKTLGLRMRQHEASAREVAAYLNGHGAVRQVWYPGLPGTEGHETASRQMSGYGAVISFEVRGDEDAARKVVNSVKLARLAVSLGDTETLIELPAAMTHRGYPPEILEEFGLSRIMIRISVGLEDPADLMEDLDRALYGK